MLPGQPVNRAERTLQDARHAAREAKLAYDKAVSDRSNAQRDVNSLLERKHSWSDADVMTFTTLVRADHSSTSAVVTTSATLKDRELAVDKAFSDLTSAILQRYHEEQVWSDKIRSVSTWANIVGLLFNFFIFLVAIAIVEPWKRKRLVERMEERMANLIERVESEVRQVSFRLTQTSGTSGMAVPLGPQRESSNHMATPIPTLGDHTPSSDVAELFAPTTTPIRPDSEVKTTGQWQAHIHRSLRLVGDYLGSETLAAGLAGATLGLATGCIVFYWAR